MLYVPTFIRHTSALISLFQYLNTLRTKQGQHIYFCRAHVSQLFSFLNALVKTIYSKLLKECL